MLTVRQLHERIEKQLEQVDGWHRSRVGHDLFGRDARQLAHHAFAVGVPRTTPEPDRQRARGQEGQRHTLVTSTLSVRWSRSIRAPSRADDLAAAHDDEATLRARILDLDVAADVAIRWTGAERAEVESYVLGRLTFDVLHRIPLE